MPELRRIAIVLRLLHATRWTRRALNGIRRFADQVPHWQCSLHSDLPDPLPGPYHGVLLEARPALARACLQADVPFVTFGRAPLSLRIGRVAARARAGGATAARHLDGRGYPHFGYLALHTGQATSLLRVGYTEVLHSWGRRVHELSLRGGDCATRKSRVQIASRIERWLDPLPRPIGVLATSDWLARHLAQAAVRLGWNIPRDLGIVGTGNDPLLCGFPDPPLTSLDFHPDRMGAQAAKLLEHLINGGRIPWTARLVRPTLILRRSTDAVGYWDPIVARALTYIAQCALGSIGVPDVARALGISRRMLDQHFRDADRPTVATEIRRRRLRRARHLLATTEQSVREIARRSGFPTGHALYKAMRREMDLSPTAYRTQARRQEAEAEPWHDPDTGI